MRHAIGIENMTWGSDYPHYEGSWPKSIGHLRTLLDGVPEDEVRALLSGNAARVYGPAMLSSVMPLGSRLGSFRFWMICPGIAPMYVRRCPRISASSCIPPSEIRANLRPSARAMLLPSEVLPMPGGPTKHRIGPFISGFKRRTER